MNVLQYSTAKQLMWTAFMSEIGYETKTTFYGDLATAEFYGLDSIKDTYNRVMKEWLDNVEYITEFIMCLNHKIWEFYDEKYGGGRYDLPIDKDKAKEIAKLYDTLWTDAEEKFYAHYENNKEALNYYYQVTD